MKMFVKIITLLWCFSFIASCGSKTGNHCSATEAPLRTEPVATEAALTANEQWAKDNGRRPLPA